MGSAGLSRGLRWPLSRALTMKALETAWLAGCCIGVALALSLDMVLVAGLVMAVYLPLQRRSARWLA